MSAPTLAAHDAALLDAILGPLADAVREVGLPLHILLESRFGELNDNQVEMIEAAREHAAAADALLRQVHRIRALDGSAPTATDETTRPLDLFRSGLAIATAHEARRDVRFDSDLSPALARVRGDRTHLAEAITLILREAGAAAATGGQVCITAEEAPDLLLVRVSYAGRLPRMQVDRLLAARLVEREGGRVEFLDGSTTLQLRR